MCIEWKPYPLNVPDHYGNFLVTLLLAGVIDCVWVCNYHDVDKEWRYWDIHEQTWTSLDSDSKVIAWAELVEPYREEEAGE